MLNVTVQLSVVMVSVVLPYVVAPLLPGRGKYNSSSALGRTGECCNRTNTGFGGAATIGITTLSIMTFSLITLSNKGCCTECRLC